MNDFFLSIARVPLLAPAFTLLAIWCGGRWLLERIGNPFQRAAEITMFSWALGCLLVGLATLAACVSGLAYPSVSLGIAVVSLLLGGRFLPWRHGLRHAAGWLARRRDWLAWASIGVVALFGVIYTIAAMAPETAPDAMSYHLGFVRLFLAHHRLVSLPENYYSALPEGMEMVFLFCSSLGGYAAARLAHLMCLFMLAGGVYLFAQRLELGRFAAVPALAIVTSPLFGDSATVAEVDVALSLAVFLAFYAAYNWRSSGQRPLLLLAGLLAGLAMSIKPTGAVAAALVAVMILWPGAAERALGARTRAVSVAMLLAGAVVAPWLARNWVVFQNPLMPIGNRFFPNAHVLPAWEAAYRESLRHYNDFGRNLRDYLAWPLEVTVIGRRLQGQAGPFFLLAPLALLTIRKRTGKWLLAAALITGAPQAANILLRFMMPALPFLALGIMLAIRPLLRLRAMVAILAGLLLAQCVFASPWVMNARMLPTGVQDVPFSAAFHLIPERDYLSRKLKHFDVIEFLENKTPPDSRVLTFGDLLYQMYTSRPLLFPWGSEQTRDMLEIIDRGKYPWFAPDRQFEARFAPVEATVIKLVNPGQRVKMWPICEVEVLDAQGRVIDSGQLAYSASLNRFAAKQAADREPVSCWSTHEDAGGGVWFSIDLRGPRRIAGVRYLTSAVGADSPALLYLGAKNGKLERIDASFQLAELPSRNWKGEASGLLKSLGVDYIVFNYSAHDPYFSTYRELLEHKDEWGLREVYRNDIAFVLELRPSMR